MRELNRRLRAALRALMRDADARVYCGMPKAQWRRYWIARRVLEAARKEGGA